MDEHSNKRITFADKVKEAKRDLKTMYLNEEDERDWAMAWSGGKDSTVVAGLVTAMLQELPMKKRKRKIHVVMSDTMVENPILEGYMRDQVKKMKEFAQKNDLPLTVNLVHREANQSYFYLTLGRGYFLPMNNGQGRWCTGRLKLAPQNEIIKDVMPSYFLTGARLSESTRRGESIKKWTQDGEMGHKIGDHALSSKIKTFMPIVEFTIEDVWQYLQEYPLGWSSAHPVRTLYRDATGECGFSNPKGTQSAVEACGARFGCWLCPVIVKDRSTEQMSITHEWMRPLTEWRELQMIVYGGFVTRKREGATREERRAQKDKELEINSKIKMIVKSGHKRNGSKMIDREGNRRTDQGTQTVEARKYLFSRLIETEDEVNRLRAQDSLPPLRLISDEEIELIKKMWKEDEKESSWLVSNKNGENIDALEGLVVEMRNII